MKWLKPVLIVVGVAHMTFGAFALYRAETVARLLSIDLLTPGAFGEIRAVFGGLMIALGVAIVRGAVGGKLGRQWLYAVALSYAGLACGRLVSLGMDGLAAHTGFAGLVEIGMAALMLWAGIEVGASPAPPETASESRDKAAPKEPLKPAKPVPTDAPRTRPAPPTPRGPEPGE